MTIPEIFASGGEKSFRAIETKVLAEAGKQSGKIISTGGGCVTVPENYPLLHQNGVIVRIKRDIAALPTDGRPISQSSDMAELAKSVSRCIAVLQILRSAMMELSVTRWMRLLRSF